MQAVNQNSCNEWNHAVMDRIRENMIIIGPIMSLEVVHWWELNSQNILENQKGFIQAVHQAKESFTQMGIHFKSKGMVLGDWTYFK